MGSTENLKEAFAGESQANRRYIAFAKKADADGLPQVARLFRAAAEAETVHAHAHLNVLGGVKSTADNLQVAINGQVGLGSTHKEYHQFIDIVHAFGPITKWNTRVDTPGVKSFVRGISQGETLGVSISQILRNLADEMRKKRKAAAEELAQKAPIKMLFPLIFLIFPAMFVVLLLPAIIAISDSLGG